MHLIKRSLSIFLIFVLFITVCFENFNLNTQANTITTAFIEGENINVRSAPSTSSPIIEQISYSSATVLESQQNAEGLWYMITYNNGTSNITGYIFYNEEYIRIVTYNPDATFEEKLTAFPQSYHEQLKTLHAAYPNWNFIPDNTNISFKEAVKLQASNMRKQVEYSENSLSWCSMGPGAYDWSKNTWISDNGGWTAASNEIIAYYMDPRNFLNSKDVFQFMKQSFSQITTEANINKILEGTFLANGYTTFEGDLYGGSYSKVLIEAGKTSGVDPCVLAALILQEQGSKGTSDLISGKYAGYENYYNFFNISASGSSKEEVIKNGLDKAVEQAWNTIPASIIGGAKFYKTKFISIKSEN